MKARVLTAVGLAPLILLVCLLSSPYPIFCLCLLATTVGFMELRQLLGEPRALPVLSLVGVALPFFGSQIQANRSPIQLLLYVCLFFLVGVLFSWLSARKSKSGSAAVDLGGLWIAMPLSGVVLMHDRFFGKPLGWGFAWTPILCLLVPVWASDIAAMIVGRRWGRHPLWQSISPKKTLEGAVTGLIAALLASAALWPFLPFRRPGPWWACGLAVGLLGQLGDLFESYMKRVAGVKDSGSILPGHGGLLDRIDSLLFSTPAVILLLVFWPT